MANLTVNASPTGTNAIHHDQRDHLDLFKINKRPTFPEDQASLS